MHLQQNACVIALHFAVALLIIFHPGYPTAQMPPVGPQPGSNAKAGDPVDLGTGLYEHNHTDIRIIDSIPIALKRSYRNRDSQSRAFGIGTNHNYDWFLVGDASEFKWIDLVLEDGGSIHYDRISPGTGFSDAVFEHVSTPTKFQKSRLNWNGRGWDIKCVDGSLYSFGYCGANDPRNCGLVAYSDPVGRKLQFKRDPVGNLLSIVTEGKRGLEFVNDAAGRIKEIKSIGSDASVKYEYDGAGRLRRVENAGIVDFGIVGGGGVLTIHRLAWIEYEYDDAHNMTRMTDSKGFSFINEYNAKNRPIRQVLQDGTTYRFSYVENAQGQIVRTDVTETDESLTRTVFNDKGYVTSNTTRLGSADEVETVYERDPISNATVGIAVTCISKNGEKITTKAAVNSDDVDSTKHELLTNCRSRSKTKSF